MSILLNKKILLGITGSIAAYKSILLLRLLKKEGAEVRVIITNSAKDFVSPLVLSTLSENECLCESFKNNTWVNHIELGVWADIFVIAPLSCNSLAKMANGMCDNLLLLTYLSTRCATIVSPAMDEDMWKHPLTQKNIQTIETFGVDVLDTEKGFLASGIIGEGRMQEPEKILEAIKYKLQIDK